MGPRVSLLGKFSALSLLAMLVLALSIGTVLHARMETRALRGAEQLTTVIAQLTVAPRITRAELARPLPADLHAELDRALAGVPATGTRIEHVKLFGPDGRIVYADEHERIGELASSDDVRSALGGSDRLRDRARSR